MVWNFTDAKIGDLLSVTSFMAAAGIDKCCISTLCWTFRSPVYAGIAMPWLKGRKAEKIQNVTEWLSQ